MIRLRSKVGALRFRELMTELLSTIENIGSSDQRGVAEFYVLLGPEHFSTYLGELVETLETKTDPGAFWAKWVDVVVSCLHWRVLPQGPCGPRASTAPARA
jgi:hypothetical protein